MTIYDSIVAELPGLRQQAASMMRDTFAAYSPGGVTLNEDDFEVEGFAAEGSTLGRLTGGVYGRDTNTRLVSIGGVDRPVVEGGLHIPLDSNVPAIGWEYECIDAGPASDPGLVGRRYRVVDVPLKSYATARRLDVVDVTD